MSDFELLKGHIVQVIDENHDWFTCLVIVDEVKQWGIQGYMHIPKQEGDVFIRLENGTFEFCGISIFHLP